MLHVDRTQAHGRLTSASTLLDRIVDLLTAEALEPPAVVAVALVDRVVHLLAAEALEPAVICLRRVAAIASLVGLGLALTRHPLTSLFDYCVYTPVAPRHARRSNPSALALAIFSATCAP